MKRKEPDWKQAYGPDPDEYRERFERTLSSLKEERTVNKKIALRTVLIAALVSLLLVGTALAVGSALGILNFFERSYGVTPSDNAAEAIHKALGSADDGQVRLTVREAVYDGETVRALLAVEPLDAQKYIVANEFCDTIEVEYGKTAEEYARLSGRTVLGVRDIWIDMMNPREYTSAVSVDREGDVLLTYCEISVSGERPETAQIVANVAMLDGSSCTVPFMLEKTETSIRTLQPGDAPDSGATILSANLSQTPFADYLRVIYQVPEISYGQTAQAFTTDATYYMTEGGIYAHTEPTCSGMANAHAATCQEATAAGKLPCPACAGGDMALMAGGEAWTIELLNEEGQPVKTAGTSGGEAADAEAENAYSQLIVMQSGSLPTGNLYICFTAPDGEVFPPVKLK